MKSITFYTIQSTLIGIVMLLMATSFSYAQGNWQLRKQKDGIKVFTSSTENSEFKTIKVECTLKATPTQLVALIMDIGKQYEWVYGNKSSRMIKVLKPNDFIFYSQVNVPWPCANRDFIVHMIINQPSIDVVSIDLFSEPDMVPLQEGFVRVRQHGAHWNIQSIGNKVLNVVYTLNFNPAGSVPAFITNLFVVKAPFETFVALKQRVALPKFKNATIDFIKTELIP
jgi:hypothetical protein